MRESEKNKKNAERKTLEQKQEGKLGMKFIEGHPICKNCLGNNHSHPLENVERADCKNIDSVAGQTYQCQCGFGGVYQNGKWQARES